MEYIQADATNLENIEDNSIESISALHSIEHFGLGRYGDPIDPDADHKAMQSLQRVLKPGGKLYFAVPIGKQRLCYNAHRIYNPLNIIKYFNKLELVSFDACSDNLNTKFVKNAKMEDYVNLNLGQAWSLGIFEFTKK